MVIVFSFVGRAVLGELGQNVFDPRGEPGHCSLDHVVMISEGLSEGGQVVRLKMDLLENTCKVVVLLAAQLEHGLDALFELLVVRMTLDLDLCNVGSHYAQPLAAIVNRFLQPVAQRLGLRVFSVVQLAEPDTQEGADAPGDPQRREDAGRGCHPTRRRCSDERRQAAPGHGAGQAL